MSKLNFGLFDLPFIKNSLISLLLLIKVKIKVKINNIFLVESKLN
jgi:hypothetical protein